MEGILYKRLKSYNHVGLYFKTYKYLKRETQQTLF